jgi:hypothetical protein
MENKNLLQLLGPSKFSAAGFIGTDTRKPEEIIAEDLQALKRLGVDKKDLVAALRAAYVAAERALGNPVELSPGVTAVHHESRGRIPSPFSEDGTLQKGETVVTETQSGASFTVTPLSLNLIDKHDFFQGKGSPYRIDPETACRMLRLIKR